MIEKRKHIDFINKFKSVLTIETYSLKNSSELAINYVPNSVDPVELKKIQQEYQNMKYDVFFLGRVDNDRLNVLIKIAEKLKSVNLTYKFYTVLNKSDNIKIIDSGFINKPLPYKEYLKELCQSRTVIDLFRISPEEGLSFRTAEALTLDKRIITNRSINNYKFFNKDNIFVLDNNLNDLIGFINDKSEKEIDKNENQDIDKQFNFVLQINRYLK